MLTAPIIFYCLPSYHQNNKYLVRPNTCYEYDSAFPLNKLFSAQIKEAFRCTSGENCFSDNNPQQTLPDFLTESYVVIFVGSVRKTTDYCTDPEDSPTEETEEKVSGTILYSNSFVVCMAHAPVPQSLDVSNPVHISIWNLSSNFSKKLSFC